jgi:hypothetical protein
VNCALKTGMEGVPIFTAPTFRAFVGALEVNMASGAKH